mmetsp:Transcript_38948/g.82812  ORF Transcript_38948/g.82812 Transcript_38948/m.82812 type:complete len:94 (-) Transcript_38948:494-775(-)
MKKRLEELRGSLEVYRARMNGCDPSILPVLSELERLDKEGALPARMLKSTKLPQELNRAWWRRESHGPVAARSGMLLLTWIKRTNRDDDEDDD